MLVTAWYHRPYPVFAFLSGDKLITALGMACTPFIVYHRFFLCLSQVTSIAFDWYLQCSFVSAALRFLLFKLEHPQNQRSCWLTKNFLCTEIVLDSFSWFMLSFNQYVLVILILKLDRVFFINYILYHNPFFFRNQARYWLNNKNEIKWAWDRRQFASSIAV